MNVLCRVVVLMGFSVTVFGAIDMPYDCRREGSDCPAGFICSYTTGFCTGCTSDVATGQDCAGPTLDQLAACTDTTFCKNSGRCYEDPIGTKKCYCTETLGYFGTNCERPRVDVVCTTSGFEVTLTPFGSPFAGVVYVNGKKAELACNFATGSPKTITYATSPCGTFPEVTVGGDTVRILEIVILYNAIMVAGYDQRLKIQCKRVPATNEYTEEVQIFNLDPATVITSLTESSGTFDPAINMHIQTSKDGAGISPTDVLDVGDIIKLTLILEPKSFSHFKLMELKANDNAGSDDQVLIEKGCVAKTGKSVITSYVASSSSSSEAFVTVELKAFKYFTTDTFKLIMTYVACPTSGDCERLTCPADSYEFTDVVSHQMGVGETSSAPVTKRRRRSTNGGTDQQTKEGTMEMVFNVRALNENEMKDMLDQQNGEKSCVKNIVFLLPLILMAIMLVISMAMTLFFCLKVIHKGKDDIQRPYKA